MDEYGATSQQRATAALESRSCHRPHCRAHRSASHVSIESPAMRLLNHRRAPRCFRERRTNRHRRARRVGTDGHTESHKCTRFRAPTILLDRALITSSGRGGEGSEGGEGSGRTRDTVSLCPAPDPRLQRPWLQRQFKKCSTRS
jgi:hypothetical protein